MWFIGVEVVEQETSAPPPKKNPGSAPGQLHITSHFGGGGEIRPCNSNIAYPRFEVYETFLCVFMGNSMVFMR